jgi:putative transposase
MSDEYVEIADWLIRLTHNHKDWGVGLRFDYLRNMKYFGWNHKLVYRIYRELELIFGSSPSIGYDGRDRSH